MELKQLEKLRGAKRIVVNSDGEEEERDEDDDGGRRALSKRREFVALSVICASADRRDQDLR